MGRHKGTLMFLGGEKLKLFATIFADSSSLQKMVGASISVWCRTCLAPNMKPKSESVVKDQVAQLKQTKKIVNGPV